MVRSFGCCARMAASARRSSARRSSNDIAKGSFATGERHVAVTGFTGASRAASRLMSADARATSTARAATRSASAAVTTGDAAKPHAPSAIARTPKPNESTRSTFSSAPFFTCASSTSRRTKRTSA